MKYPRLTTLSAALLLVAQAGCATQPPDNGTFTVSSKTATASGEYKQVDIDSVERISIEGEKLVLHGAGASVTVDLPDNADPQQKNKGWALVTESEGEDSRTFTFTQETSLEDFSVTVPAAAGQLAYGSLGGRDGRDVVIFAYGSDHKAYWGWANVQKRSEAK
jgi:hypothetical protein